MCEVLEVSRSGYYSWRKREPSVRAQQNEELAAKIAEVHKDSRRSYGSRACTPSSSPRASRSAATAWRG